MLTTFFCLAFGCGPLSLAALEGNLKKMSLLLNKYRDTINELNLLKQTPLHLAVGYPSCVALLLRESGSKLINLPDIGGNRPMDYALFCCLYGIQAGENQYHGGGLESRGDTSLNILLDAGCMVTKTESWPRDSYYINRFILCDNCLRAVSVHLVGRREGLKRLAANNLPCMQATALGVFSPYILDSNATRVIQALDQYGISVPEGLQVHGSDRGKGRNGLTSEYHRRSGPLPSSGDGPLSFPDLWSLGFRDVDIPDMDGVTPLISWYDQDDFCMEDRDADRCSWLIEKGADLWKLAPDGVSTTGHELYYNIARSFSAPNPGEGHSTTHVLNLTQKLSHRDPRDNCRCACSPGGCTPFVRFLQALFYNSKPYIDSASRIIEELITGMKRTHTSLTKVQMRSAVRYATFEMLGIRHTCCHPRFQNFHLHRQNEELEELRQEDCFLVACLEDLIADFEVELELMVQERYVNKRVSFWHGCWLPRIQQVLESIHSTEIEEPDRVAAEEIGLIWHKRESGKGKECDGDVDLGSDPYSKSEDGSYHESDWGSEIDKKMVDTSRIMEDYTSGLDLIMSKAGLSAGR